ncbi:VOC family protein [Nonomuraea sp. NPDC005692]|uniref:VOC family protein n=1 Tax=Nonomuraea sp. NPDC005692 TaxID=3157168 RepID=UPI00340AB0D6
MNKPAFTAGLNIAMEIPKAQYEATVAFYRDTLGFEVKEDDVSYAPTVSRTHSVRFGPNTLWLDCVDDYSRRHPPRPPAQLRTARCRTAWM